MPNSTITDVSEKAREARLRRMLRKEDVLLRKSRVRYTHGNDYGEYMLVDASNCIVAGEWFNLSLDDVERWLNE